MKLMKNVKDENIFVTAAEYPEVARKAAEMFAANPELDGVEIDGIFVVNRNVPDERQPGDVLPVIEVTEEDLTRPLESFFKH